MRQIITCELTWLDAEQWASVWRCTPSGERRRWEGFKRLDASILRSPAVRSVTTIVDGDLRRALVTLVVPVAGGDGAEAATRSAEGAA